MEQIKQLIVLIEQKNDEKLSSVLKDLKSIKDNNSLVDTDILKTLNEILNVSKTINKDDIEEIRNEVKTISESINKKQDNPLMEDLITAIKNIKIEQPSEISIKGMGKLKGATGEKGDKGDNGYTPIKGVDYFDGEKGEKGKDGSPDTPEQIVEKINTLENVIDIKTIKDFPVIEGTADIKRQMDTIGNQVLRLLSKQQQSSGGGTWGSITGTLSNQTDLQNALNLKYDASNPAGYITASALSGYTPTSRTITINGVAQDLSTNRSWTVAVPTLTSELTNDSGFITSSALASYLPLTGATYTTTTGNGLALTTSTLTSGNLVSLSSTGTGAGSNTQTVLNIATSGANGTSTQTTYGTYVTNTHTGTASTNVAGYFSASGGTNNYGLIVANGNVGIGTATPLNKLDVYGDLTIGNGAGAALKYDSTVAGGGSEFVIQPIYSGTSVVSIRPAAGSSLAPALRLTDSSTDAGGSHAFSFGTGSASLPANVWNFFSTITGNANANSWPIYFGVSNPSKGRVVAMTIDNTTNVGIGTISPTAVLHLKAGTATASTAPLKFTSGTLNTTAEAGAIEYNNTFHVTNSDAIRRHIVTAPNNTKVTASAPYTNDGYITINIGGTDFKVMTTA